MRERRGDVVSGNGWWDAEEGCEGGDDGLCRLTEER
jgi:hypothetical protein